ncbi:rhodanese-like domain-containing protein [Sporosarcina sp. FSL K6-6792]|uniref:rhodanese-like domain-containing protein n=1 Tax=Sporosarcina sp. FSL K6-6792 TaxID=2921559 RepID=UPI0030F7FF79
MRQITTAEIAKKLQDNQLINIIDVREVEEVAAGKIPNAVNIPLGLLEFRMNEMDKDAEYIMVCRSGGRSGSATQFLENYGYKAVNMVGGMLDWDGPTE